MISEKLKASLPQRPQKPRELGLTMVIDKGLSLYQAESLLYSAEHLIDFIKLGFGTSLFTKNVEEKIKIYHEAGIKVYLGGTLFEAFIVRGFFEEYLKYVSKLKLQTVEVSDGCISIPHEEKCNYIKKLSQDFLVLSEVGSKDASVVYDDNKWIQQIVAEKQAGSWKVITEARESGNVGIYDCNGKAKTELIDKISHTVSPEHIIWEAPLKSQQVWLINHFGANVNLGNIAPDEIIALEALRNGLRGDTFFNFLPKL